MNYCQRLVEKLNSFLPYLTQLFLSFVKLIHEFTKSLPFTSFSFEFLDTWNDQLKNYKLKVEDYSDLNYRLWSLI